jgi:hypothetical protein
MGNTPCPATGKTDGLCRGYVAVYSVPLSCGGADSEKNMEWDTTAQAKLRARTERAFCSALKSGVPNGVTIVPRQKPE